MNLKQLEELKKVYDGIDNGISNPLQINKVYAYLPSYNENAPMRAKIQQITRYIMFNYEDMIKTLNLLPAPDDTINDSIGDIDNLKVQSHKESSNDDLGEEFKTNQQFLTKEEKEDLKTSTSGTTLEIKKVDGRTLRSKKK